MIIQRTEYEISTFHSIILGSFLLTFFYCPIITITFFLSNSVRYWSVYDADIEKNVSHTESITCYIVTFDCETLITGSSDASLKVWEAKTGKLTQVLVGHQQQVTCVAVAPFSSSKVLSGSTDQR